MIKKKLAKSSIYFFKSFSWYQEISHFITTRLWGNLALHVGDDPQKVLENRKAFSSAFKIPVSNFVFANQIHGNNIAIITDEQKGKGSITQEDAIELTDGLITNQKNICITILVADCVPILMFDPIKKVIGAIHAGRKGTQLKIAEQAVKTFKENFKTNPKDLVIGLGPSIGPCCYEFFQLPTPGVDARKNKKGNWSIDLWEENKKQLIESGVLEKNIEVSKICTSCNKDTFFSARGDGETTGEKNPTGRFAAGIFLLS